MQKEVNFDTLYIGEYLNPEVETAILQAEIIPESKTSPVVRSICNLGATKKVVNNVQLQSGELCVATRNVLNRFISFHTNSSGELIINGKDADKYSINGDGELIFTEFKMGSTTSKNLGLVSAVHRGNIQPTNIELIWFDTNTNPITRRIYDVYTDTWEALTFVNSPANLIKSLNYRITNAGDLGNTINIEHEDVFIKSPYENEDTPLNIPAPSAFTERKSLKLINKHPNKLITLNWAVGFTDGSQETEVPPFASWEILCVRLEGGSLVDEENYSWQIISQ